MSIDKTKIQTPKAPHLSTTDLNEYLSALEEKRIHYQAELIIRPGDENSLHNLDLLEKMTIQALARL